MPTIQIKKTGEEPGAASLAVTVPVEQVQEAEARATSAYQRRARLPGFRKGKAPAALVKRQFADDIRQQTLEELIRESWKAALAQEALKPVADPHIHNLKWEAGAGGPVTFEFHVEVKPELTLERELGLHLHVELEGDGAPRSGVPFEVVDVRVGDRLQRLLRQRRLPAFANQVFERLLPNVLGELPLHERRRRFPLAKPRQPGPPLVGGGGARLRLLHLLHRYGDGEGGGAGLFAGLLDLNGGHAKVNLIAQEALSRTCNS